MSPLTNERTRSGRAYRTPSAGFRCRSCCSGWPWPPITNIAVPQLEEVGKTHNVALNSPDAPSLKAIKRIGQVFHEFDTDSSAMVVLEGDKPLGDDAHRFYDDDGRKLEQDRSTSSTSRTSGATP